MEEAISERPISQELQTNQCQTSYKGSVGPTNTKPPEEPSHDGFSSRQTGWSRTHVPSGNFERSFFRICRDFMRGNCTYGESCKFRHTESDKHDRASNENDPNVQPELRRYRSRSPCRNFLRGRCINGANCRRMHIESTSSVGPRSNRTSHHDEVAQSLVNREVEEDSRSRSPCRKFLRGSCLRGSSCPYMHPNMLDKPKFDYSTKHQQGPTYVKDAIWSCEEQRMRTWGKFGNDEKIKEFCLKFSKGRCDRGDSCRYLHSFHEYAKSNPVPSKEQPSENSIALGSFDGSHRNYDLVPFRYHHHRSYHRSSSSYHLDNRPHSKVTTSMNIPSREVDEDSNNENPNQKSGCEHAKDDVQLGIVEKGDTPSESHLTNTRVMSNGTNLHQCCVASLDSNNSILDQKIDISEGQLGVSPKEVESESTSPCEYGTSLRNNDDETSEAIMKTYSRKRRKMTCFKCHTESLREASTGPTMKGPSNNVSVIAASNEHENEETTNEIQDNAEIASALMETSGSLIKEANSNFKGKLLILDVNGILADIVAYYPESFKPDTVVSMKGVFKRPFCDDFLEFCFERFDVGVWSSRNKNNVDKVTEFLMGDSKKKLLFCWDQSYCTDTGYKTVENRSKPLVLKELKRLWEKQVVDDLPWEKGYYNETNTILLDDSPYKALLNPPYTAVFPFPFTFKDRKDTDLGPNGKLLLYLERLSEAENVQKFIQENPFGQRPITESNLSWRFYSKIIEDYSTHNQDNSNVTPVAS